MIIRKYLNLIITMKYLLFAIMVSISLISTSFVYGENNKSIKSKIGKKIGDIGKKAGKKIENSKIIDHFKNKGKKLKSIIADLKLIKKRSHSEEGIQIDDVTVGKRQLEELIDMVSKLQEREEKLEKLVIDLKEDQDSGLKMLLEGQMGSELNQFKRFISIIQALKSTGKDLTTIIDELKFGQIQLKSGQESIQITQTMITESQLTELINMITGLKEYGLGLEELLIHLKEGQMSLLEK